MKTSGKVKFILAVEDEHRKMKKYNFCNPTALKYMPPESNIITSTWAMNEKSNGKFRSILNDRGYENVEGIHYEGYTIASPVTNDMSIRIIMVSDLMTGWLGKLFDVKGEFLHG